MDFTLKNINLDKQSSINNDENIFCEENPPNSNRQKKFNNYINFPIYNVNNFQYIMTCENSTQTNSNLLDVQWEDGQSNQLKRKRRRKSQKQRRKFSPDDIRSKIFVKFNKKLCEWLKHSIKKEDNIKIISFRFVNNKTGIKLLMNEKLKELFVPERAKYLLNGLKNEILIKKLDYKYEDAYNLFLIGKNNLNKDKIFFEKFYFLEDYLEELKETETNEYISKVKTIAIKYKEWLNKKIHLFSKKSLVNKD